MTGGRKVKRDGVIKAGINGGREREGVQKRRLKDECKLMRLQK